MLDPEIKGRLLAVRAKAAAIAGFYEEAVERFTESLQILPGRLSPEPLIRLHLLRDDLKRAREAFERYKFPPQSDVELPLRLLLETLGSDRKPCAKTLDRMDKPNSPEGHLYQGLLLNLASKNETAFPYLQEYLSRVRWGEDLASRVLLPLTSPDCAMCRAEKATTHWDGAPVCRPCNELLTCEPWKDQAFLQPTPEQKRLLENILGENADFAQELFAVNTPIETQCEVSFSPSISLSELLPKLDPVSGEAWQEAETLARERARNVVGTGELGLILVRNSEEARDLFRGDEAQRFLIEFGERPEEESDDESKPASMELLWVLNVANWLNTNLPPFRKNGISIRDLAWALDLTRALPGTRASGFVAMVMGDRLAARQRDYFEELVVHRPNSLFLRSVLSGRSRYDFRPESYAQSTQHRLWIIRNCPSTYPRHSIDYAPALDFYQIVLAWSETIQNFADDPQVLAKGAELFSLEDDILKQALLCRCRALDPENTEWKVELAIDLDYAVEDERDQVQVAASCLELMQPYL
ncbi:MAG: hypothetical protein KC800_32540, partial [Candidatus Eremiobacteraeota bacterium]|nr:hypothetical protein [Candidatus Eremiobacteraeota bacterium]